MQRKLIGFWCEHQTDLLHEESGIMKQKDDSAVWVSSVYADINPPLRYLFLQFSVTLHVILLKKHLM